MTELQLDNSLTGDADADIKAMATTTTITTTTVTTTTTSAIETPTTTPKATAKRRPPYAEGESEEGFLSTSPDSANGDVHAHGLGLAHTLTHSQAELQQSGNGSGCVESSNDVGVIISARQLLLQAFYQCSCVDQCVKLDNILDSFKAPLSEDQAWALVYQFTSLYHKVAVQAHRCAGDDYETQLPRQFELHLHRDGSVHFSGKDQQPQLKQQQQQGSQQQEAVQSTQSMPLNDSASSSGDSSTVINRGEF